MSVHSFAANRVLTVLPTVLRGVAPQDTGIGLKNKSFESPLIATGAKHFARRTPAALSVAKRAVVSLLALQQVRGTGPRNGKMRRFMSQDVCRIVARL